MRETIRIPSDKTPTVSYYLTVDTDRETVRCTCPGFHFHAHCKHAEAEAMGRFGRYDRLPKPTEDPGPYTGSPLALIQPRKGEEWREAMNRVIRGRLAARLGAPV